LNIGSFLDTKVRYDWVQELEYVFGLEFHKFVRISSTGDASRISLDGGVEEDSVDLVERWYSADGIA
jgi:hypothetical protein